MIPSILYHGTFARHYESILRHGIGGAVTLRNFHISLPDRTYLAEDPYDAERYAEDSELGFQDIIVLEIDATYLDPSQVENDLQAEEGSRGCFAYRGTIPANAITEVWLGEEHIPETAAPSP